MVLAGIVVNTSVCVQAQGTMQLYSIERSANPSKLEGM